jgi:hypothetical protein
MKWMADQAGGGDNARRAFVVRRSRTLMSRRPSVILPVLAAVLASAMASAVAADEPAATPAPDAAQMLDARRARLAEKREQQFRTADRDGDRGLSRDELAASSLPKVLLRRFDEIDSNHDGRLEPVELQALEQKQIEAATRTNTVAEAPPRE